MTIEVRTDTQIDQRINSSILSLKDQIKELNRRKDHLDSEYTRYSHNRVKLDKIRQEDIQLDNEITALEKKIQEIQETGTI